MAKTIEDIAMRLFIAVSVALIGFFLSAFWYAAFHGGKFLPMSDGQLSALGATTLTIMALSGATWCIASTITQRV